MPSYLTAGKIKEGMSGTISGEPREEKHDFQDGKGEKTLFRVPITLDQPILDEYNEEMTRDWIWNPGVFARSFLEKELGMIENETIPNNYQSWINTHGSFHPKAWASKTRNGFAWHFIPDAMNVKVSTQTAQELITVVTKPIPVPPEAAQVEAKQLENFPKQVPSTNTEIILIPESKVKKTGAIEKFFEGKILLSMVGKNPNVRYHFDLDDNDHIENVTVEGVDSQQQKELESTFKWAVSRVAKEQPIQTTTQIECAYCAEAGDMWSTARPENMKAHIEKYHPEKVTPNSKVKARVKKE